jgi:hypothetical protein
MRRKSKRWEQAERGPVAGSDVYVYACTACKHEQEVRFFRD